MAMMTAQNLATQFSVLLQHRNARWFQSYTHYTSIPICKARLITLLYPFRDPQISVN